MGRYRYIHYRNPIPELNIPLSSAKEEGKRDTDIPELRESLLLLVGDLTFPKAKVLVSL
jgi:hypothetical protein